MPDRLFPVFRRPVRRRCGQKRSSVLRPRSPAGRVDFSAPRPYHFREEDSSLKTRILAVDPAGDNRALIEEAAESLVGHKVMAFPTETFYGLGAAALSAEGVGQVYALKRRDPAKPLPLIASDLDMVRYITASLPLVFWALAEEFWPGPLTCVLEAAPFLPAFLTGPGGSLAVRVPPVSWLRALAYEICQPLTATSANISGGPEIADAAEVRTLFEGKVDLIVDGGRTPGGRPSTIVDLTCDPARILREGAIPAGRIKTAVDAAHK